MMTLAIPLFCFFPWMGVALTGLFLTCLVAKPHCLPASLLNEIALLNLIVRAKLTRYRSGLNQEWWHEIIPGLYLGGIPLKPHLAELQQRGVQAVYAILDDREAGLTSYWGEPLREKDWTSAGIHYVRLRSPDRQLLTIQQLNQAAGWIQSQRSRGSSVYLHCKGGRERSPMVAMAYLMQHHHLSLKEAKACVLKRPLVHLRPSQEQRMKEFEQDLRIGKENENRFQRRDGYR
jgi:atypical dual specificity phosphatase